MGLTSTFRAPCSDLAERYHKQARAVQTVKSHRYMDAAPNISEVYRGGGVWNSAPTTYHAVAISDSSVRCHPTWNVTLEHVPPRKPGRHARRMPVSSFLARPQFRLSQKNGTMPGV